VFLLACIVCRSLGGLVGVPCWCALTPKKVLGAFVREALGRLAAAAEPVVAQRFRLPLWSRSMTSPALMLDWLEATSSIKSIRQHAVAAKAWTRVIARSNKLSRSELASNLDHVTYDGLRLARVRLDVVSMLVWRAFWVSMLATAADDIDLYIYCDASPQKGSEYFAATVDLYDRRAGTCGRWLLPCLVLDPTLMDAMGKTFALLWQVFLTAGPQFHLVRTFCNKVRSLTTDMGSSVSSATSPTCFLHSGR
jgi:hypothetical protein